MCVDLEAIRRYAQRPWARIEASKREHWARQRDEHGAGSAVLAAHALWLHMRRVRPDWPTEEERAQDLADHVALQRAFERAGRGLAGR